MRFSQTPAGQSAADGATISATVSPAFVTAVPSPAVAIEYGLTSIAPASTAVTEPSATVSATVLSDV